MKSDDDNVLGKGIEAIFQRTAHLRQGGEKTIELPNGVISREGDELVIRMMLGPEDDIRGAVDVLKQMSDSGMLDDLQDHRKIRSQVADHIEMARMAMDDGDLESAIEELETCLRMNDSPAVRYNLAVMLEKADRTERAVKEYRRVLKADPRDVEALNNLGILYYEKGDITRSMEMYERAVKIRPSISEGMKKNGLFGKRFGFRKMMD
ncbi:tetratricopeptide repeat protein [bacterium]|nr:tetratricopeptide repeat protein [candidate division CSSED10-310 bacterium]